MPKLSTIVRAQKKPKFKTRKVLRCFICGRRNGYIKKFNICRIHFRELANQGLLPGVRKSSW